MWPFRRKPLLDADTARWHLDNFAWLVRNFSGRSGFAASRLLVPGDGCFVTGGETGHALALRLFDQVKTYAGLQDSGVVLVVDGRAAQQGSSAAFPIQHGKHAIGTYSWGSGNAAQISYAPKLLESPQSFIATMAHELAHHLLHGGAAEPAPIDADEDEHLTDLTAVYMGFGVFLANSAFNMKTHANGWSYSRQGYLPEQDLIFATAIHIAVRQIDPGPALRFLKAHLGQMLRQSLGDLKNHRDEIAAMRKQMTSDLSVVR